MNGEPIYPTKPYIIRLDALRKLEKLLGAMDLPTYMIFDFPQQASSFDGDIYQPLLLVGDPKATRDVRYLHGRPEWYYALDGWQNNRGHDPGQIAGELCLWWAEVLAEHVTQKPDFRF